MKPFFTLVFALLATAAAAQMPCPPDTLPPLSPTSPLVERFDTINRQTIPCCPHSCEVIYCESWQLPDSFTGHLEFTPLDTWPQPIEVMLVTDCNLVLFDDCRYLQFAAGGGFDTTLIFPASVQLVACSPQPLPVWIVLKPSGATDSLHSAPGLVDLDTLCPTGSIPPQPAAAVLYVDLTDLAHPQIVTADAIKPNRRYKKLKLDR